VDYNKLDITCKSHYKLIGEICILFYTCIIFLLFIDKLVSVTFVLVV